MTSCPAPEEQVENRIDKVLTQYRESPNLLAVIRTYLGQVAEVTDRLCDLPTHFDLRTATGDQLTLLGKRMGWPRCHCVCSVEPVFGFECDDDIFLRPVVGFCEATSSWEICSTGISDICLTDDELYRRFLMVRRYQYLNLYNLESFEECLRIFFGEQASVLYSGQGRIVAAPGRNLTAGEISLLQLYARVLPIALGIRVMFHFGPARVFGFGEGWGGFEEENFTLTESSIAFQRTGKIFGFCEDDDDQIGGFCETWDAAGQPLWTGQYDQDSSEIMLVDENGVEIYTGPLTEDAAWVCRSSAPWMCEIDVRPYDC